MAGRQYSVVFSLAISLLACGDGSIPTPTAAKREVEESPPAAELADQPASSNSVEAVDVEVSTAASPPKVEPAPTPMMTALPHVFEPLEARTESLIPPGTPPDRAAAYVALPVRRGDGTPVGAIGVGGTHLDDFVIGYGFTKGRCDEVRSSFDPAAGHDRVSVCVRVVHQPVDESIIVRWIKDGRPPRKTVVKVKAIHAYRTRAWFPINEHRRGDWTVVVETIDGTELARGQFSVT